MPSQRRDHSVSRDYYSLRIFVLISFRDTTDRTPGPQRCSNTQRSAVEILWKEVNHSVTKEQGMTTKEVLTTNSFSIVHTCNAGQKLYKAITRSTVITVNLVLALTRSLWISDD